jgi:endonuclease/exonuclease/phosphatase family metal-dependent hydrolase
MDFHKLVVGVGAVVCTGLFCYVWRQTIKKTQDKKKKQKRGLVLATWNVLHQKPLERFCKHSRASLEFEQNKLLHEDSRYKLFVKVLQDTSATYGVEVYCLQEVSATWLCDPFISSTFIVISQGTIALLIRKDAMNGTKILEEHALAMDREGKIQSRTPGPLPKETAKSGVTNGVVTATFNHLSIGGITVASTHLPFQGKGASLDALTRSLWEGVGTALSFVLAGDFNIDAMTQKDAYDGVRMASPANAASLVHSASFPLTHSTRGVHDGRHMIIDHVISSLGMESVVVHPSSISDLVPHGQGDEVLWNSGLWPSDHAMVIMTTHGFP